MGMKTFRISLTSLILIGQLAIGLAADSEAAARTRSWRAGHEREILSEFVELLALPNLASDAPNIERNAAAIATMCAKRGLAVQTLRLENAPPIVVADLVAPGAKRTIAFYAHYDGQPVDAKQWKSDPWQPVMRDAAFHEVDWRAAKSIDPEWRLYARSSGDDKAPIVAMLAALDALRDAGISPSVNLRFVFEGEEEGGSPHMAAYLEKYPKVLRPDAWILCDGPVYQSRRLLLAFGARGEVGLELTLFGPVKGLHDGHYGNWVANPALSLVHLLASMRDETGRILIKGFSDQVRPLSAAERDALAKIPNIEAELRKEFQIASNEGEGKPLNELLTQPALNVRGLEAGHVGAQASNTIQPEAHASIDFRLVPNQTPESIKPLVENHIRKQGYEIVHEKPDAATRRAHAKIAQLEWDAGMPPARTALDLPLSREVAGIMSAMGHEPVRLPTMGGSIPMYLFQQPNDTPVILLPIANHDDNQHAADENMRLQNLWDGMEVFAALFAELKAE